MAKNTIPKEIKEQVQKIVDKFNKENDTLYVVSFRTNYCYLARIDEGPEIPEEMLKLAKQMGIPEGFLDFGGDNETKIGRLKWTGDMNKWAFTVFKYSSETYDPEEWFFPGFGYLDGSIEGAMRAGLEIYPG